MVLTQTAVKNFWIKIKIDYFKRFLFSLCHCENKVSYVKYHIEIRSKQYLQLGTFSNWNYPAPFKENKTKTIQQLLYKIKKFLCTWLTYQTNSDFIFYMILKNKLTNLNWYSGQLMEIKLPHLIVKV